MALAIVERLDSAEYSVPVHVRIRQTAMPRWKRFIDIVGASVALGMCLPLMAVTAVWIMLDSPGGAFVRQPRVGHGGMCFNCWKFRTMHRGAAALLPSLLEQNEASGPVFKMKNDPRRTRVGRLVRRTSLDELPQLLNVLRGEMSLVGPRPPLVSEVLDYDDHHLQRLAATPGMTGLWQVTLRGRQHDFADMVALDVDYARRMSFKKDVMILLKTVPTVIFGRGSV
jgi:lipopolysaccharide/colanic/teichoic acid biosynthesis glycosyltransferase